MTGSKPEDIASCDLNRPSVCIDDYNYCYSVNFYSNLFGKYVTNDNTNNKCY